MSNKGYFLLNLNKCKSDTKLKTFDYSKKKENSNRKISMDQKELTDHVLVSIMVEYN